MKMMLIGYTSDPSRKNEYLIFNSFSELREWVDVDPLRRYPYVSTLPWTSLGDILWLKRFTPLNITRDGRLAGVVFQSSNRIFSAKAITDIADFTPTSNTSVTQLFGASEGNIPIFIDVFMKDKIISVNEQVDYFNTRDSNFYRFICRNNAHAYKNPRAMQIFDRSILEDGKNFEERFGVDYETYKVYELTLTHL